jgi:phage-related protein
MISLKTLSDIDATISREVLEAISRMQTHKTPNQENYMGNYQG